jgi:hypothetical protein
MREVIGYIMSDLEVSKIGLVKLYICDSFQKHFERTEIFRETSIFVKKNW